ncbi:DUF4381 domain-containing protein [Dokdonia sp. Hel_I_53]|uniref:DUF4381 domain-containing protein n=1 Tax=Dokdonia sp. Hel_I_53 TaxID=1566287 RepID=UPI00119C32FF|nr:DUF4381 domain-containing protein [Dokdonia sp. Hel_I_53]TVZ52808.1 hypothetical protein OD90_1992 [Dokdonia sp. Hel_I_53]
MIKEFFYINKVYYKTQALLCFLFFLSAIFFQTSAQENEVRATIDSTSILIGQQINYKVEVLANQGESVVFPEGQTFTPLEVIESYTVDTANAASTKMKLVKKYGLTQFDSGRYIIPRQKIIIGTRTVETDSFLVAVNNVVLDTVNQGLYDIKPIINLPKDYSNWWKYLLYIIPVTLAIVIFLWWLLHRNKKRKEAEKYIPPYEQAIASLQALDQKDYIVTGKYKEYYSELTDTVRRYYNEKVYDRSLESTTDELLERLQLERDSGNIDFNPQTITRIKDIFKRADLIKFARVNPPEGKAQADRHVVEEIVKETKDALPAPTVEELMKQEDYRESLSRKRTRKLWLSGIGGVLAILLLATGVAIGIKGLSEVQDFVFGNMTRELSEGTWITSEYGSPSMVISTPKVLERKKVNIPEDASQNVEANSFVWISDPNRSFTVALFQTSYPKDTKAAPEPIIDVRLKYFEEDGTQFSIVKNEKFETTNGGEGVKVFGTGKTFANTEKETDIEYALLVFVAENTTQELFLRWHENDEYSTKIANRILQSVEVQAAQQDQEKE